MRPTVKLKWLIAAFIITLNLQSISAQSKADIFNSSVPITWLGLDFSQTKFIGTATNSVDFGFAKTKESEPITNDVFRDRFTTEWNHLFVDEEKKYNVAAAVHRESVNYALDVSEKTNKSLKKDFFSENPGDFKTLDETKIADVVKHYDFQKNKGIGLIFFVEGMSKGLEKAGVWVTFVDMGSKTVLFTNYMTEKPGGFGFKNYWAKPYAEIIKKMTSDFNKWK